MIPLYGFLEGDVLGLLILAEEHDTAAALARNLQAAAALRVAARDDVSVWVKGMRLDPRTTLDAAGLCALDRFDVRIDPP
ncbi:MAG: hypothetical protein JWM82_2396 [Myxococcales bacterium]|nr:hypothetical protein [Myxococcales bacterium]